MKAERAFECDRPVGAKPKCPFRKETSLSGFVSGRIPATPRRLRGMTPRQLGFFLVIAILVVLAFRGCHRGELRVGTYNVRRFGVEATDMKRLRELVSESGADVLALQEIEREGAVDDLARRLSGFGHTWRSAVATCAGKSTMRVGFVYDEARARLVRMREYPELDPTGNGACSDGERSGLAATFAPVRGGKTVTFLAVHFVAGGTEDRLLRRKEQWKRAMAIAKELEKEGPMVVLGDTNSTGYADDRGGERSFVDGEVARAGMTVLTRDLPCSEYFHPDPEGPWLPSLLDHVVTTKDVARPGSLAVHGHCRALACKPSETVPKDFETVSDHCPVTFELAP